MLHKKVQIVLGNKQEGSITIFQVNESRGAFWQNITGSVDAGESIEQAAKRELVEESGIETDQLLPLNLVHHFHDQWGHDVEEFSFLAITTQTPRLSDEHQDYKVLPLKKVQKSHFKFSTNFESYLKAKEILERVGN